MESTSYCSPPEWRRDLFAFLTQYTAAVYENSDLPNYLILHPSTVAGGLFNLLTERARS
jgi:hypothetical protein